MEYPWSGRHPWVPEWFPADIKYSVIWHCAGDCHFRCPYCFNTGNWHKVPFARDWTDEEAAAAWEGVYEQSGACHMTFSGLEPGEDLELIAAVLAWHYGTIQTNLSFDLARFTGLMSPQRIDLHPSFHPHAWGMDIAPFMAKVDALMGAGYEVPLIAIVAYPPYLPRLGEWAEAIAARGIFPHVVPMVRAEYEGRPYPESYTAEDWAVLKRVIPEGDESLLALEPLDIAACGAGHVAAVVNWAGDVHRCGQVAGMGGQNLFRDGGIEWLPGPEACSAEFCPCPQFQRLHLKEENADA